MSHTEKDQWTGGTKVCHDEPKVRTFETGATRDTDQGKLDYEGFLSPLVLKRFAQYMHLHRKQADGKLRDSDNWQKGIPVDQYIKSMWRHFIDVWTWHRDGDDDSQQQTENLSALLFNVMGMMHELLAKKQLLDRANASARANSAKRAEFIKAMHEDRPPYTVEQLMAAPVTQGTTEWTGRPSGNSALRCFSSDNAPEPGLYAIGARRQIVNGELYVAEDCEMPQRILRSCGTRKDFFRCPATLKVSYAKKDEQTCR